VPPAKADVVLAAKGKVLFEKLCVRCHGADARGNETIPRLAGQQVPYVIKSVTRYRDRSGERNSQAMAIAAGGLKDDEIVALAQYLALLP
jgi:cytochrome c553